jgi:uncharacterized repeat protein (TIGR03803 family)
MKRLNCICDLRLPALAVLVVVLASGCWAQSESVIYSFTGGTDGGSPQGGVILDSKGNLYGTAENGGANGAGVVFEFVPNSNGGWTEQVIYNFNGFVNSDDGALPDGPLVFDKKGNLYGATQAGGTSSAGTVFELSPGSNGAWTEKVIYNFLSGVGNPSPFQVAFVVDTSRNLYASAQNCGTYGYGCVFELVLGTNGDYTEKVLYSFSGDDDGYIPLGSLIIDSDGNLYGTTLEGGAHDYGVVFELSESNGTWTEKVLYAFTGAGGISNPIGRLALDSHGNIYGTAFDAFELSPNANGTYKEENLHFFSGGKDGALPSAGVIIDSSGNLYGTTSTGGAHRGTVFELSPNSNGKWSEKVLHSFSATGGDGIFPYISPLAIDKEGRLYGTTGQGGAGFGVVYEVTQ